MNTIPTRNPRTGRIDGEIENWTPAKIAKLAAALRQSQADWHGKGLAHRREALLVWRDELDRRREAIAAALTVDTGRRQISLLEVQKPINLIDYWLEQAPAILENEAGRSAMAPTVDWRHVYAPYSLVGVISPWNFPLALASLDAIPALLAGCAVIIKPSEVTSRFVKPLLESIARSAGFRRGVAPCYR